jgi:hypothetical protein
MPHKVSFLASLSISMVRLYQKVFINKIPTCRYLPTCSEYSIQAFEEWGFARGLALTISRILRCHPFATQRVDEVPKQKSQFKV